VAERRNSRINRRLGIRESLEFEVKGGSYHQRLLRQDEFAAFLRKANLGLNG